MNEPLKIPLPAAEAPFGAEELAHYARTGWLAARGFFSPAETAAISRWTDELAAAPEIPGRQWVYRENSLLRDGERVIQRIENFCPFHQGFDRLVRGSRLEAAAAQLMGGPWCSSRRRSTSRCLAAPASSRIRTSRRAGPPTRPSSSLPSSASTARRRKTAVCKWPTPRASPG
jgi:hypothetical protein